jgi:hypothetical protein
MLPANLRAGAGAGALEQKSRRLFTFYFLLFNEFTVVIGHNNVHCTYNILCTCMWAQLYRFDNGFERL